MKIVFISNYFNHHQKPLSDELYRLTEGNYFFIETIGVPEFRKQLGYQELSAPYVVRYSEQNKEDVMHHINNAEIVIIGHASPSFVKERIKQKKLVFSCAERPFKSPKNYLKSPVYAYKAHQKHGAYMLCASAFTASDYNMIGCYINRCYKWGYFPAVSCYDNIESVISSKAGNSGKIKLLWCARFIDWKHPEVPIYIAEKLKNEGIAFELDMIGTGEMETVIKESVETKNLGDVVRFLGSMPPTEVRHHMEEADIFLFTSDRQEGWGAVLNEAMNSACAVVASHAIGSVPYLINHGDNGLIYRSGNNEDVYQKILLLVNDKSKRRDIQLAAYKTMTEIWSPKMAALNLITLYNNLVNNLPISVIDGPGSVAPKISNNWFCTK